MEFDGLKTAALDFESEAAEIQTALQKLVTVGSVDIMRHQYGSVYTKHSTNFKWHFEWAITFTSNAGNLDSTANIGNVGNLKIVDVQNNITNDKIAISTVHQGKSPM